jgi:hypothetical protein
MYETLVTDAENEQKSRGLTTADEEFVGPSTERVRGEEVAAAR